MCRCIDSHRESGDIGKIRVQTRVVCRFAACLQAAQLLINFISPTDLCFIANIGHGLSACPSGQGPRDACE